MVTAELIANDLQIILLYLDNIDVNLYSRTPLVGPRMVRLLT